MSSEQTIESGIEVTAVFVTGGDESGVHAISGTMDAPKLLVTLSATDIALEPKRHLEYLFMRWLFLPETLAWLEQVLGKLDVTGRVTDEDLVTAGSPKPTMLRQERLSSPTASCNAASHGATAKRPTNADTITPNSPAGAARSAFYRILSQTPGSPAGGEARVARQGRSRSSSTEEASLTSSPQSPVSHFIRKYEVFRIWSEVEDSDAAMAHGQSDTEERCHEIASYMDSGVGHDGSSTENGASFSPPLPACEETAHQRNALHSGGLNKRSAVNALFVPSECAFAKAETIPRFYYPDGRAHEHVIRAAEEQQAIQAAFDCQDGALSQREVVELIMDIVGLPSFVSLVIFERLLQRQQHFETSNVASEVEGTNKKGAKEISIPGATGERIHQSIFLQWYVEDCAGYDRHARLFHALQRSRDYHASVPNEERTESDAHSVSSPRSSISPRSAAASWTSNRRNLDGQRDRADRQAHERRYLVGSDFRPFIDALLATHPGLQFLQSTPEFQHRYAETVIERIFYYLNRPNGQAYLSDIRRHRLLDIFRSVDEQEDINQERSCFSYEHFYVIYCRFWELDTDHDLMIDREDLLRYNGHALTYRIIDCIFSGRGRPLDCARPGYMSYTDFIWFILSEEDKNSETALDYWFRCIDADGDGKITLYDVDWLYSEQLHRMECLGHEPVAFEDILCQLLDMISKDLDPPVITRSALRSSRMQSHFFNILFNLNKFIAIESRDPSLLRQERAVPDLTDWDRFAALEYLRLSAEDDEANMDAWSASDLEGMYAVSSLSGAESPF
ncbi:probable protein phosphatase 2A regulatory subunit [Cyanidioschyzon merolae strain 10D]|uniref:Probable protein phosphatase 2A regulatory subunit n=1 Tax=Cyanidioschyzon merolae (strain NIES-3377 / 10D) TaxID=280699 RepID=M1V5Z3_CYAM1|nr:probable protein phosphatase 2A regulatory subunit [Cyanidioschyzon merolae strain 10D]BAM81520.1 probable protein phosphatase 2A regulatory subunit [Cyanidioschyzon merolae strain 10D]|eukprot:XP_005537556.1 probable protein phosphatase 2A regulatory subunit [Cyanidioschyzon merolae strain 10D]